jgi:hypothetical protein
MLPVRGGTSHHTANGSPLSTRYPPPRATTWNLYTAPCPTPGTNASQIPLLARGRSGSARGSQRFASPMNETVSAFGAQTAK